jgi:REP element-mobilizing transposase RayT
MARKPRIEYAGAFYHIIVRGNQRQDIFLSDEDRREYLTRLSKYKEICGFNLYAYVLMGNHVHLLMETPRDRISRIMQRINLTYTYYFNRKYNKVGHLFQGRYTSYLCDKDEYLLALVRYIHLNPVRAGIANSPDEYIWSSHNAYSTATQGVVETALVLRLFSELPSEARMAYRRFVSDGLTMGRDESLYAAVQQQIIGDERFIDKIQEMVEEPQRPVKKPKLQDIVAAVTAVTGLPGKNLASTSRQRDIVLARGVMIGIMRQSGYRLRDIAEVFNREISSLSKAARMVESEEGTALAENVMKRLNTHLQA